MRSRRGVALLAALWLVVAIATVAMQFSLEARERRTLGILASERGIQRAAALGALALTQARLDYALRVAPSGNNAVSRLRASDPWLGADSTFSGRVLVDSIPVDVTVRDLGEMLNINQMTENELRTFFSFLLRDFSKATQLAQSIMDWRDADSIPRPSGAELDAYVKAEQLALPANSQFREIEELQNVIGMTPEIYAEVVPYLTTRSNGIVNLNSAPIPVLRALPNMTDATINQILQLRAQGRRINDIAEVFPTQTLGGRPIPGQAAARQALNGRVTTETRQLEIKFLARVGPQAPPSLLTTVVARGNNSNVSYRQW